MGRKGQAALRAQGLCRGAHQQAHFPVAGVVAQCQGLAVLGTQSALGAEDEILRSGDLGGIPAHAGVLRQAEEIAAACVAQQFFCQRQCAGGAVALTARDRCG